MYKKCVEIQIAQVFTLRFADRIWIVNDASMQLSHQRLSNSNVTDLLHKSWRDIQK